MLKTRIDFENYKSVVENAREKQKKKGHYN